MSYRNPKIIVDRSAEIYAGLANTGTSFFNSYMKASNAVKDATAKRNAGMLKAINKSTEKYESRIEKGVNAAEIDDPTLIEQVQAIADKKLNGAGGDIGIIRKDAMLNMGLVNDPDLRKQYRKDIREYKAWQSGSIQNAGGYEAQVEDYDAQVNSSTLGTTKQIAGQGTERFINLTALQTFKQRDVEGVDVSRTLTANGDIIISGKMDMDSAAFKQYLDDELIEVDKNTGEIKGLNIDVKNGTASFEWRSNAKNPVKNLLIDLLPTFDQSKASIAAGIETDKGDVDKNLYTGERDTKTEDAGEGRVYDETKIYINPDIVKDNDVFNKEAKAFAEGVRTSSRDQQIDILNRIGVPIENQEKYLNDPASQANIITEALINDNIKRITGSPDVTEEEVIDPETKEKTIKYYITEYSKDRAKPKPGATEIKDAKDLKDAKTRLDIVDTLLEVEDALPVLPAVFPTDWFNSDEGEEAKQSIIDIVERSGGNIVGDVIDDGSRGFKIKVDYDGRKRTLSTNDFKNKNILKSRLKDAIGAGIENIYDDINID